MKRIEILASEPLKIILFSKKLKEAKINFNILNQAAGVFQESVSSFELAEKDYCRAVEILDSLKLTTDDNLKAVQGGSNVLDFFRGKALNVVLILISLAFMTFLLIYMSQQIISGDLISIAWVGIVILAAFIILLFKILLKTLSE